MLVIRLSGRIPGKDIEIVYTGLRPGEKLYEELFHAEENLTRTAQGKILLAHHRDIDEREVSGVMDKMEQACAAYDGVMLRQLVKRLVPEFDEAPLPPVSNVIKFNKSKA